MKEEITNVARIGLLLGGKYSVYVKTDDELQIPHVHIWTILQTGGLSIAASPWQTTSTYLMDAALTSYPPNFWPLS